VVSALTALFWPSNLGPGLDALAVVEGRERLASALAGIERGVARGTDISLALDQDALAVLLADLAGATDAPSVRLRVRDETVYVGLQIAAPFRAVAHAQLAIQPSLLDGHIFCGLREVRVGLLRVPPGWFVGMQQETGEGGWQISRGKPGYVLPASFRYQGALLEVTDLWLTNGWAEVTLRPAVNPGDR
jgi:hypothetical protein